MIRDLSQALRSILDDPGLTPNYPELAAAQITFDRPTEPFNPTQTTVNLFLYDIRENLEFRNNEPEIRTSEGQATITGPPLRIQCSYLVTAWPVGGTDLALQEHRLLSQVLRVLAGYPTIPGSFLQGSLVGQEPPLRMVALQPDALKNLSEFWSSLGNKLKPSLTVTVTITLPVLVPETAPMVITGQVGMEQLNLSVTHGTLFRISGLVTNGANAPIANAAVTLLELGLSTATDAGGRYTLGRIAGGAYQLSVQSGATTRTVSITIPATAGNNYNVQLV